MAVLNLRQPRRPVGSPAYASGFRRFLDRLMLHGLEYFQLYYGIYRGKVIDIADPDADDGSPDPQGRVRVQVRSVGDTEDQSRLAYPIFSFAGAGYGLKNLPPVDSFVYVLFENGSLDAPLWFGGWYTQDQMPDDLAAAESFGWITPGGHKVVLDEQEGEEYIKVEHQNGAIITLDKDGNIFITNVDNKKVYVGKGSDAEEPNDEPAALGRTLKGKLEELIDAINAITVPTPAGASGTPVNAQQFTALKQQLSQILSETVKVV